LESQWKIKKLEELFNQQKNLALIKMKRNTNKNLKENKNTFIKIKRKISKVVLSKTGNKEIIYGARALNKRFPPFLDKHTTDFDIFSPTPKKDAKETEKALDKSFGGNYFYVELAKHPGTFKVKSRINKEGYADYTKPTQEIPSDKIKVGKGM